MRDLVRAVLRVVRDHDPTGDQRLEGGELGALRGTLGDELGRRAAGAGALGGHQPEQQAPGGVALTGAPPGQQPIGVPGQR
ncbi:MAG TPA: hypothetical protein VF469_10440, partial [Kofleriaceae bacterium]